MGLVEDLISIIGLIATKSFLLLKEFMQFLNPLPTPIKIAVFLLLIHILLPVLNSLLCPGEVQFSVSELNLNVSQQMLWCANPELFASVDASGKVVQGTGIKVFSSEMAMVWTLLFIGFYLVVLGARWLNWLSGW